MTDENAKKLLQLLNGYLNDHHDGDHKETTIADLVDDLAMSMDHTDDESDQIRRSWGN
jgi:hypothetical protein